MVKLLTLNRSPFSLTLGTKLVLSTSVILVVACLVLGWLFIHQQVRSAAEGLRQSGTILAQHLAHMGRFSVVAGDTHRLSHLIREILAVDQVAYAAVISSGGELQAGFGKGPWAEQFSVQPSGQRQFSLTNVTWHPRLDTDPDAPLVSAVELRNDRPILLQNLEFTMKELLNIASGFELPIVYDVIVRVPQHSFMTARDPALGLTLDERVDEPQAEEIQHTFAPTLVQIGLSTSHLQHVLRQLIWQAAAITISIMATGLLIALLLARRITTPLRELTQAATQLAAGESVPPVVGRTGDEIGILTGVFNAMAVTLQAREHDLRELTHTLEDRIETRTQELVASNAKLQELDRRKSLFVSTASHELRTPLTSMKVHLANLRDGIDGAVTDDQHQSLVRVESNLSRLEILIEELLDLSQIEMDRAKVRLKPVALAPVIAKTVEDLHPLTSKRRVRIRISLPSDLPTVSADPDKLQQILLNLLHNAAKFTPVDTIVDVTVMKISDDGIRISVRDVGPGIAPEDVDKIFQPFFRAPTAHKETKGAGLGLAITKRLIELHHSQLWVKTTLGEGSCFCFTLRPTVSKQKPPSLQHVPIANTHGVRSS